MKQNLFVTLLLLTSLMAACAFGATTKATLQFRQGLEAQLPEKAKNGEPLFTTDTHRVFVGTSTSRVELGVLGQGGLATALAAKATTDSPTFTGAVALPANTSIGPVSSVELGYLDGVIGPVQAQLDGKMPASNPTRATSTVYYGSTTPLMNVAMVGQRLPATHGGLAQISGTGVGSPSATMRGIFTGFSRLATGVYRLTTSIPDGLPVDSQFLLSGTRNTGYFIGATINTSGGYRVVDISVTDLNGTAADTIFWIQLLGNYYSY